MRVGVSICERGRCDIAVVVAGGASVPLEWPGAAFGCPHIIIYPLQYYNKNKL